MSINESGGAKERYPWVDYAKGICIIGVVTLYAVKLLQHEFGDKGWMRYWVDFARPFRMPDFFLLSGLFLGRVINRPWREFLDKKVAHYLYFFVLWTVLIFLGIRLFDAVGLVPKSLERRTDSLWSWLYEPAGMLWFIYILPIFFITTRLTKRVPVIVIVGIAAALQTFPIRASWHPVQDFCERYIYFYIGYAFASYVFALATWAEVNRRSALFSVIIWAIINETCVYFGRTGSKGFSLVLGILGTGGVVVTGVLLERYRWTGFLRYLGQHSIVVYLGFFLPTVVLVGSLNFIAVPLDLGTIAALISLVGILLPILLFEAVRGTRAAFLFERPLWARLAK